MPSIEMAIGYVGLVQARSGLVNSGKG